MPSERNRHALIDEMERLYLDRAWSDTEMAEKVGTGRENVWKIRTKVMEAKMGIPFISENGRHRIDRTAYIANIKLTPPETLALYIGGRRLQQHTKTGQKDVASALEKLANALHKPLVAKMVQAARQVLDQEQDEQQTDNLRKIMEGWMNGRRLRIQHRVPHAKTSREYMVTPLQLEPAVWGDGVYLIGYSDYHQGIATFKLSRIERVTITMEPSKPHPEFDSYAMLHHAWGIWHSDKEPVTVQLRFTASVTPYVRETIWHPEQTVQDLPDGGCIWQAQIAEPKEMLPWIRGWGADVKVLGPESLKEEIQEHARQLAATYNIMTQTNNPTTRLLRLWGKTVAKSSLFHPALYHLFDVAHVAQQLLSPRATVRWRYVLGQALNTNPDTLHEWLPFLIALHDLGKLSVPFQVLNDDQANRLREEGFDLGKATKEKGRELHHTITGQLLLESMVSGWPYALKTAFLSMVGGHHGIYRMKNQDDRKKYDKFDEASEWEELRQHAVQLLRSHFVAHWPETLPEPENVSAAVVALNGFCILCDWLGSDENYFTPKPNMPLAEYIVHSRQQAYRRAKNAGLFQTAVSHTPATFKDLFPFPPRPLQALTDQIPAAILLRPVLIIIEAPTGEGKTEIALALIRRIAALRGTDEMYIALPTTATSNAMHTRIQKHLRDRLGLPPELVQLVHGQSFLAKDDLSIQPLENAEGEEEAAQDWFAPKKKALLAPFGVGTIDQAMLSAMNVKYNALRQIGLAGKVIILDEVHAYDTYMTTIIKRMLSWLAVLGSSVILLSATLPKGKRQELVESFAGNTVSLPHPDRYPSLIAINTAGELYTPDEEISVYQPDKTIQLDRLHFTEEQAAEKAEWLWQQVQNGGCAAWITNTVDRAIAIYTHLKRIVPDNVDVSLLHGRLPQEQRQELETQIIGKYGKAGTRPPRGIVVGTQVLEQSLDLDFDVMASDLAPIDLLLQRAGRLFRHDRELADRHLHKEPRLYINMETTDADKGIYTEYILNMTTEALNGRTQLHLPADYRPLIEAVYGALNPAVSGYQDIKKLESKLKGEAKNRLAQEPDPDEPFYETANWVGFEERDDEGSRAWVAALTRWGQESMTVIPLQRVGDTAVPVHAADQTPIPLNAKADRKAQLRLLRRSLRLSNRTLIAYLKAQKEAESLPLFTKSSLLKHVYPLWLEPHSQNSNVFINEASSQPVYLHPDFGLVMGAFDGQ